MFVLVVCVVDCVECYCVVVDYFGVVVFFVVGCVGGVGDGVGFCLVLEVFVLVWWCVVVGFCVVGFGDWFVV